jgi:hypothetical protein
MGSLMKVKSVLLPRGGGRGSHNEMCLGEAMVVLFTVMMDDRF